MTHALLDSTGIERLRQALTTAGFTRHGIVTTAGREVAEAINNSDPRSVLSQLEGGDPLSTLIRLFLCGQTEPDSAVAAALHPLSLREALAGGIVENHDDGIRAALHLHPYEDWWVVADLPRYLRAGPPRLDRVLDIGPTSTGLAKSAVRQPVNTALDIGTGCGVQALHLSTHAERVTATDLSARAVRFAATTAALNGLDWEILKGDLAEPVAGRRFDLVLSNPPYIVGTGAVTRLYRDSNQPGDALCARLARAGTDLLTEGGYLQFRANWAHVRGQPWTERVAGWIAGTALDAWVIQHRVFEPQAYVDFWLTDGSENDPRRREIWLDYFHTHNIEAIGSGLVTLRRSERAKPAVRIEEHTDHPDGEEIQRWFVRHDWLRDNDPLAARYIAAKGLALWQEGTPGGHDGWQLQRQVFTLSGRTEQADPLTVAITGGADGSQPLRDQLTALAHANHLDPAEIAEAGRAAVIRLVERGIVQPTDLISS